MRTNGSVTVPETELAELRREARRVHREVGDALRVRGRNLSPETRGTVEARLADLDEAIGSDLEGERLAAAMEAVAVEIRDRAGTLRRATAGEYVRVMVVAVLMALGVRAFVVEPFRIPTGSMIPTLEVDDHVFVSKFAYGPRIPFTRVRLWDGAAPQRGDVAVFEFPGDGPDRGKDFIKRIVAVGGDKVRLTENRLVVNDLEVPTVTLRGDAPCADETFDGCRCVRQRERLDGLDYETQHLAPPPVNLSSACINTPDWPSEDPRQFEGGEDNHSVTVPYGTVLAMGDNRDNSSDGRYWGFVPVENLKGRALMRWWPPGRWFTAVR